MTDLNKALAEIQQIRGQLARGTEFRGYGPRTIASTAALALVASIAQAHWLTHPERAVPYFLLIWVTTAALSVVIIGIETLFRAQRIHSPLAMEMIHSALEQFLPAIVAGLLLTVVLRQFAPDTSWMLPGLWQLIFSMGVFASCRFLPRPIFVVGLWYLTTGLACLMLGRSASFSPWAMGVPFAVGQVIVAGVLQFGYRKADEE